MKNVLSLLAISAITTVAAGAQAERPRQASDIKTRDVLVSVVDSKGVPAPGLTAADFRVREDGVAREVLRAGPATEPLDIVLLVDDSQAATQAIPYLRDGLGQFVDRLQGKASIGIVTIGERPTSVVERTTDVAAVKKGITRIFARPGSGAYLLEGIIEVSRGLQKRESKRPVIVALTMEGVEFSNAQHERVLKDLYASGAVLHVLAIGRPAGITSDELRNKSVVMAEGTEATGGRREQLLAEMAIPDVLTKLAAELLNQYTVTYGRPDALVPPEKVQVTVTRPGLTARARTRLTTR
ncbi:MAG TPA: VWA domain-containing protein [Vicinamibacterales bacterium]|nr:VWA domain-containing protein [Vicinamibacterales bacterium]